MIAERKLTVATYLETLDDEKNAAPIHLQSRAE